MSVVERARVRYYQIGGYPLSSLNIFDVQQARRTHSLQYLQQVTNLCEKIKITPQQFNKQSPSNKLKFLKAFQYSISYSQNLKSIYDTKQQELTQRNTLLIQQIKQKKQAIKQHKQKVDRRKVQYRQMKVNQAKNVYQTFSNQISNLKSKQEELNAIKMQLQSDIDLAKHQLNYPYPPIHEYQQQQQPMNPSFIDPSFHHNASMNSFNTNPNLYNQNHANQYHLNSPQFNNPNQALISFNNQNQTNQKNNTKHKHQQSNFTLNQQWTHIDEKKQKDHLSSEKQNYKIKINSYQKTDKKGENDSSTIRKNYNLKIDINKTSKDTEELYSPTINLVNKDEPNNDKNKTQENSFDDLNSYLLSKKTSQQNKSTPSSNKNSLFNSKQQNKSSSYLKEDDSLFMKKLNIESKISKKSSHNYDQYQFQDQIKQTPNLHYSIESNNKKNDLSYSKMGQVQGDLWTSTKGSGRKSQQNMKMFNNQPKRKTQDDIKNTIGSIKQSQLQESAHKQKQIDIPKANSQHSFDDIDDLDDLDLGMDTRNSIAKLEVSQKNEVKKAQNIKKTLQVSIRKLQQVPEQTQSDITKKGSIIAHPPTLNKTQQKDYGQQQYQDDYEQQFQDQLQQSKSKDKKLQKDKKNNYKSEVQIIVPSNTSLVDVINTSKQSKIFRDLPNEMFQPINDKVKNNSKGIFPDLKVILDNSSGFQHQQQSKQSQFNTINTQQLLQSDFDILQQTTYGKKPKSKDNQTHRTHRNNLDQSDKLLVFDNPLQSINMKQPPTTEIIQSTTFNNNSSFNDNNNQKLSVQKRGFDDSSLTQSIPLKKTLHRQDTQQIIEQDEDEISEQIQYQFQDSSKVNQSEKQQIQKKIVSLVRNKNKVKNNQSLKIVQKYMKQMQLQIDQQIKLNLISQKSKVKQNDWKQINKIFHNKINQIKKQSTSSQIQKKLTQIQQKSMNIQNKKTNQTSKQNQTKNSKLSKYQPQESDENIDLNYSQSLLKDELKTQLKNKKKLQLSEVTSVNQGMTNSSKAKNQSSNYEDSDLGFSSLKQKSFVGLRNQTKQKESEKKIEQSKEQSVKFKKTQQQKVQNKRNNKLMGVKQQTKTEQVSRSKYVKSITPTNNKSVSKQSALTKLQQNKYVTIQDPLNNQIALKKSTLQKKVSDDDDDF